MALAKSLPLACPAPKSGGFQALLWLCFPTPLPTSGSSCFTLQLTAEHSLCCLCSQGAWEEVLGRVQVAMPQNEEASPGRWVMSAEKVAPGHPNPAEVRPHPGSREWPPGPPPPSHRGTLLSSLLPSPLLFSSHYPSANRVELGT